MNDQGKTDERQAQADIMQRNVSAIAEMQRKETAERSLQLRVAALLTDFSGSMAFVYIHAIWFGVWVLLNLGILHIPGITGFDPYPFGLLTLIVSLEAIFLSTFVLIAQNNLSAISEKRSELDLHINLLAEQKTAKILELLDKIAQEMDGVYSRFNYQPDAETEALKLSPEPTEVLNVIEGNVQETSETLKEVQGDVERIDEEVGDVSSDVGDLREKMDEHLTAEKK